MKQLIDKANNNLFLLFGKRHKPIRWLDIYKVYKRQLFSINQDAKTSKGTTKGYLTGVLYLAPYNISGINTCPNASRGCSEACLFTAGRGVMYPVFRARVIKTLAFYLDPLRFETSLQVSINKLKVKAKNKGLTPVVRLNGTSDVLWETRTKLIQSNPDVQFYEYTKILARFKETWVLPPNLDLTFSLSETNLDQAFQVLKYNGRVAVVFKDQIPKELMGYQVINGDTTDLRFLDPKGVIVGLKAKGRAKQDKTGFVIDLASQIEKVS